MNKNQISLIGARAGESPKVRKEASSSPKESLASTMQKGQEGKGKSKIFQASDGQGASSSNLNIAQPYTMASAAPSFRKSEPSKYATHVILNNGRAKSMGWVICLRSS